MIRMMALAVSVLVVNGMAGALVLAAWLHAATTMHTIDALDIALLGVTVAFAVAVNMAALWATRQRALLSQ